MVQPEPVSDLVCRGAPQAEVRHGTSRKGRVENNDTIIHGVSRVVHRKGGITQKTPGTVATETNSVEVEGFDISLSKSVLHGGLHVGVWSDIVEPGGIQCPGNILQLETEACSVIILIQDIDLILDLGISEMGGGNEETLDKIIERVTYGT